MIALVLGLLFATFFWFALFAARAVNFWWGMTAASGVLAAWSLVWAKEDRRKFFKYNSRHIFRGIVAAAILYLIFGIGDLISSWILPFASAQVDEIYANRSQLDARVVGLLLFFWIGPAEEIFWRGMVQRQLSEFFGRNTGWIAGALIYAVVHLWAANFVLFMAALIAGLSWGWMYKRYGSLWPGIISHSLWDVMIFLVAPM